MGDYDKYGRDSYDYTWWYRLTRLYDLCKDSYYVLRQVVGLRKYPDWWARLDAEARHKRYGEYREWRHRKR